MNPQLVPTIPMLADFSLRLAGGLVILLLLTPWRLVPPAFFRTHAQIILGLLVLAALDLSRFGLDTRTGVVIACAVLGYLATVTWGLGLVRLAVPLTWTLTLGLGGVLIAVSWMPRPDAWALGAFGRLASAFLLGSTFTAMLLGHHYLTAPTMSIEPLRRIVKLIGLGLVVRIGLASLGLWLWWHGTSPTHQGVAISPLFLTIRWLMGFGGLALATVLTWKTVEIRSTQSATGILYIAVIFVLLGELTALQTAALG